MTEIKTTEAQRKAKKKYEEKVKNDPVLKARNTYLTTRRMARSFIRNHATLEDLEELEALIKAKRLELE